MYWVRLAALCERFKCLPEPGGVFNQQMRVLDKLETALRAIDAVVEAKLKSKDKDSK